MTTTDTDTFEAVREIADRIESYRPDVTVSVYDDDDQVLVYATRRVLQVCGRCGQELSERPGPLTWVVDGEDNGSHSHQHGCGEVNNPAEVSATMDIDADTDTLDDAMDDLLAQLDAEVNAEQADERDRVADELRKDIAYVRGQIDDGDDDPFLHGTEVEPGVWQEPDGQLRAWAEDPCGGDEPIVVCEPRKAEVTR